MGPSIPPWVTDFYQRLGKEYKGREFAATYDYDSGSWRFVERDVEDDNGIHVYAGDIEMNGYGNELSRVIEFFKPEEKKK